MKSNKIAGAHLIPAVLIISFSVILVAWDFKHQSPQATHRQNDNDTVPKKNPDKKIRDLDEALDEIDNAELKLNMDKIKSDVERQIKEVEKAIKKTDFSRVKAEIDKAMKDVDVNKIKAEIDRSMKEFDVGKIKEQIETSIAKVDWDKIKSEMDEVKKIDMSKFEAEMKKVEEEMKEIEPKIKKEMEKEKLEIEKAKTEMKEYKSFVDGLEKEGLINKKEGYSIEHKDGELIINGKKQSSDVYNKYRSFLEKHKKFNIKKSDDDFDINNDD
jgi:hypothetical protein